MKSSAIKAYSKKINKIAKNISKDFGAEIFPMKMISAEGVSFALFGDIVELYNELVRDLLNKVGWGDKFSEKYIENKLNSLIAKTASEKSYDKTVERVKEIDDEYIEFTTKCSVFIPIFGLAVSQPLIIGKVEFLQIDNTKLESILCSMKDVILLTSNTDEEKQQILEIQRNAISLKLLNSVCSHLQIVAEPNRVKELAEVETQRALDILMFSIPALYPPSHKISLGLWGEVGKDARISLIYSDTNFKLDHQMVGPLHNLTIDSNNISRMEELGVFRFSQILNNKDLSLTDFEETVLRSLHWYANSLRQSENENAFINLITALESLLTPRDGSPIGTAIAEGCAFLLSKDLQARKRIKRRIKELYGFRSGVSHGEKKAILDIDLIELRAYLMVILKTMANRLTEWSSQKDLLNWIEDQKFEANISEQSH